MCRPGTCLRSDYAKPMNQRDPNRILPARMNDIVLQYSSEEAWFAGEYDLEIWHVSADAIDDENSESKSHVGDFEFIVADPYRTSDLWGVLDGHDADMTEMAVALLEPGYNDFRSGLLESLNGLGSGILIMAQARLEEPWQGFGVGAALAGKAIARLGDKCRGAACWPMPVPRHGFGSDMNEADRARGSAALAKTWARLGFEPYYNDIMILDLGLQSTIDLRAQCMAEANALPQPEDLG